MSGGIDLCNICRSPGAKDKEIRDAISFRVALSGNTISKILFLVEVQVDDTIQAMGSMKARV